MSTDAEINLDFGRAGRIGFDEAIYAAGKSPAQLAAILAQAAARDASLLLTRLDEEKFRQLPPGACAELDFDPVSRTAFFRHARPVEPAPVAVVTAGTSDVPVSREALRTLRYYGHNCLEVNDVGVAGLRRVLDRLPDLRKQAVVIVAAGMDGALPSVVGGLVPGLVIAVPTSVGYGVAAGGMAALHAMLASCAPGLVVVNVDNGYGAACAALRFLLASGSVRPRASGREDSRSPVEETSPVLPFPKLLP